MKKFNHFSDHPIQKVPISLILLVIGVALLISLSGFYYFQFERQQTQLKSYNELKAVAKLKINQLKQWRKERLSEAIFFSEKSPFNVLAAQIVSGDTTAIPLLQDAYNHILSDDRFDNIIILNKKGKILFTAVEEMDTVDEKTREAAALAEQTGLIQMRDFYYCKQHQAIHIEFVSPLFDADKQAIAVMIFRTNPESYLYPLIKNWPTPSKTAETFLVRKEDDSVRVLNQVMYRENEQLQLMFSMAETSNPAVLAADGFVGLYEGPGYIGRQILAHIDTVGTLPWKIIVKAETSELYADLYKKTSLITVIVVLGILFFAALVAWFYHNRQKKLWSSLANKTRELMESQEQFSATLYSIGDGVITTDTKGFVIHMNPVAERLTGWSEAEARNKKVEEVFVTLNH